MDERVKFELHFDSALYKLLLLTILQTAGTVGANAPFCDRWYMVLSCVTLHNSLSRRYADKNSQCSNNIDSNIID